jgi:hypothetical protein
VFNGVHPETGEELVVVDDAPEGFAPYDLPAQEGVFAPDYAPEEIAGDRAQAARRRRAPDEPTGIVANDSKGVMDKVKEVVA